MVILLPAREYLARMKNPLYIASEEIEDQGLGSLNVLISFQNSFAILVHTATNFTFISSKYAIKKGQTKKKKKTFSDIQKIMK